MRALLLSIGLSVHFMMLQSSLVTAQTAMLPPDTTFGPNAGRGDLIWINLSSSGGEEFVFGVDTGATLTVLDKSWEHKLEARHSKTIVGARWPILGVFAAPPLFLGSVQLLTGELAVTEDLAAHFPGRHVSGILGMDCLAHYCLQFDFSQNKLRFIDASRLGEYELGTAFPIEPIRGCFFVHDNLAGVRGFGSLIDTGCNFDGVLTPDLFRQWTNKWDSSAAAPSVEAHFPDGIFGGVSYTNLYLAGDGGQNLVGLHFLARNLVTLNFPGHTLYLRQQSAGPPPGNEGFFRAFYKSAFRTH